MCRRRPCIWLVTMIIWPVSANHFHHFIDVTPVWKMSSMITVLGTQKEWGCLKECLTFSVWFSLLGLWTYVVRVVWPHLASLSTILLFLQTRPQLVTLLKQWRGSADLCHSGLRHWRGSADSATVGYTTEGAVHIYVDFCHSWLHHWRGSAYFCGSGLPESPLKVSCCQHPL